jgi:hypothetical protein
MNLVDALSGIAIQTSRREISHELKEIISKRNIVAISMSYALMSYTSITYFRQRFPWQMAHVLGTTAHLNAQP